MQLLEKSAEVKSYDPKVSMLHYVVMYLDEKDPSCHVWTSELGCLEAAAKVTGLHPLSNWMSPAVLFAVLFAVLPSEDSPLTLAVGGADATCCRR